MTQGECKEKYFLIFFHILLVEYFLEEISLLGLFIQKSTTQRVCVGILLQLNLISGEEPLHNSQLNVHLPSIHYNVLNFISKRHFYSCIGNLSF